MADCVAVEIGAAHVRFAAAAAAGLALALAAPAAAQVVTQTQALDIGRVALSGGSGSATVTPGGAQTCASHYCLGSHQVGSFQVTGGFPLAQRDVTFSAGDLLTRQGGSETLLLQNLTDSAGGRIEFSLLGTASFSVGAELVLPATTVGGNYVGTYTVTIENQ